MPGVLRSIHVLAVSGSVRGVILPQQISYLIRDSHLLVKSAETKSGNRVEPSD